MCVVAENYEQTDRHTHETTTVTLAVHVRRGLIKRVILPSPVKEGQLRSAVLSGHVCEGTAGQRESILRVGQEVETGSQQADIWEGQERLKLNTNSKFTTIGWELFSVMTY